MPRAVWVFSCVAAGFVLARFLGGDAISSTLLFAIAAVLGLVGGLTSGHLSKAGLIAAAIAFGCGWFVLRIHEPIERLAFADALAGKPVTFRGVLAETPRYEPARPDPLRLPLTSGSSRADMLIHAIRAETGWQPWRGRVRLVILGDAPGPQFAHAGDAIDVTGVFMPPRGPMNPGERDARLWGAQEARVGSLRVEDPSLMTRDAFALGVLDRAHATWLSLRGTMADRAHRALLGERGSAEPDEARSLLAALILGEEDRDLDGLRELFVRFGIVHVLSISGFHMVAMAFVALLAIRLTGDRGWIEPAIVAVLIAVYLLVLPVNTPLWRSGLTVLALLAADASGRRYRSLGVLAWVALALILWRPMDLFAAGFQLSFLLTAALRAHGGLSLETLFGTPVRGLGLGPMTMGRFARQTFARFFGTSALCWSLATPLALWHTGIVSLMGIVSNLVLVPLIAVLVGLGYATLLVGLVTPPLGELASGVLIAIARAVLWLARALDAPLGWSIRLPQISLAWTIAATAGAWWAWQWRGALVPLWTLRAVWIGLLALLSWLALEVWRAPHLPRGTIFQLETLAVGDGTCHIVRAGDEPLLWDCGSLQGRVGERLVPRAVRALGLWHIRRAVITHPNLDHYNGLLDAAEPLGLRQVFLTQRFLDKAAHASFGPEAYFLEQLRVRGIDVRAIGAGEVLTLGSGDRAARIEMLSPPLTADWPEDNDWSLVARITHPGSPASLLLCGDIQADAMRSLLESNPTLRPTAIEAPHHGSAKDFAIDFVRTLDPQVVVQSTGPGRANDPRWNAIKARSRWLTTVLGGAASIEFNSQGVRASALRE